MIKAIITNLNGQETNSALFNSQEDLGLWLDKHIAMGTWRFSDLVIPAVPYDEMGRGCEEQIFLKTHNLDIIPEYVDQESISLEARKYLSETDWYVVRQVETGTPIPEEVSTLRARARSEA